MCRRLIETLAFVCLTLALPAVTHAKTWEVASDTTNPGQRLTNALLNAANGDRIHVSAPGPYVAPSGGWLIRRSIELFGDGAGKPVFVDSLPKRSTLLKPQAFNQPVLVLDLSEVPVNQSLWNVYVHDLQISQDVTVPARANPFSNGVYCKITDNKCIGNLRLARLFIYGMGNDGIHLEGKDGKYDPVGVSIEDCSSSFNTANGLFAQYVNQLHVTGGEYGGNWHKGAWAQGCAVAHFFGCIFESNERGGVPPDTIAAAQLFIENSGGFQVSGCHFEGFVNNGGSGAVRAVTVNSPGGYIGECFFNGLTPSVGSTGIYVGWSSQSIVIGPNDWAYTDMLVEVADDPATKSCTVLPQTVSYTAPSIASKVVIPDAPDRGHLIITPTNNTSNLTAGIVLPRLLKGTRDTMVPPASGGTKRKGLLIYNETSNKLNFFDGSVWRELSDTAAP